MVQRRTERLKHRLKLAAWVSWSTAVKPDRRSNAVSIGDSDVVKLRVPYPGRSLGFRLRAVVVEVTR